MSTIAKLPSSRAQKRQAASHAPVVLGLVPGNQSISPKKHIFSSPSRFPDFLANKKQYHKSP